MDDQGLLEWAGHEIKRTKVMLKEAEAYAEELRQKVKKEAECDSRVVFIEKQLRRFQVPAGIWSSVDSINQLIDILIERREFLVGCVWNENGARIDSDEC